MQKVDIKRWLDSLYDQAVEATPDTLAEIQKFTVIWFVFERLICGKNANLEVIRSQINRIPYNIEIPTSIFNEPFSYFKLRYTEAGKETTVFNNIFKAGQKDQEAKNHLINVLTMNSPDPKEVLIGLSALMYRYRNNLFHGEKDVLRLDLQRDNFIYANAFLSGLTSFLKETLDIPTT